METNAAASVNEAVSNEFENLTDEDVILRIKSDEGRAALDYLINKYRNFVRAKARSYFLIGADREDIIQEGMIGLYKAIRDFRNDKLSSFRAFAELCVTRQIITAIKTATRQKHIPLNSYVSLNKPIYDEDSERTLLDVLSGACIADPEELVISREEFIDIEFEGRMFKCVKKCDEYLKIKFNDYMRFPPVNERTWKHHPIILDFDRNYEERKID